MFNKVIQIPLVCAGAIFVNFIASSDAQAVSIYLGSGYRESQISKTFEYNVDGFEFTATAFDEEQTKRPRVYKGFWGLGVTRGYYDSTQLDGKGLDETLRLSFRHAVRVVSATFSAVGRNDDATVTIDGAQIFSGDIPSYFGGIGKINFANTATGSLLDFSVVGKNDDYYLKSVDVEKVPEPMTILGTGLALGVGAVLERKRSRARKSKAV